MKNILIILGTRPEAIKLAPVILELQRHKEKYNVIICNTEQQKELSNQTLGFFSLKADINLDVMTPNQTLAEVQARILNALSPVYSNYKIDATIVQGDTMTVFCAALTSFYNKVPVFHVEAGLRSYNLAEPFPEEAMRQMTARITALHFAPTQAAKQALIKESIPENNIVITGNTVIDALHCLSEETLKKATLNLNKKSIILNDKLVLITAHRRENHGERLENILEVITELAKTYSTHQFILPVHPNPNVKNKVYQALDGIPNVVLTQPLDYPELVAIMKSAKLILTDSGGIQEEAPSFGCPLLVLRYETERNEGVEAGFAKLVGADKERIIEQANKILELPKTATRLHSTNNPYGDGQASVHIHKAILSFLKNQYS